MSASLASFAKLCAVLVGRKNVPDDLAQVYFHRARIELKDQLDAVLGRFDDLVRAGRDPVLAVRSDLLPDAKFGATVKVILLLWYIGGIQNATGDWVMGSADQYYRALVWEDIGAHPPTLSNGYYGHWKYPPEI